jgi:hypothetical protein
MQNHPSSVISAWEAGYSAEIDVQGTHNFDFRLGHDSAQYPFELPSTHSEEEQLILHLKSPLIGKRVCEILYQKDWLRQASILFSPSNDAALERLLQDSPAPAQGPKRLCTIDNRESLDMLLDLPSPPNGVDGVWLEQPKGDWVDQSVIENIHLVGKTCSIVSPELHGRRIDLTSLHQWKDADAICTDFPHLFSQILNALDPVVYPVQPWWK